MDLQPLDRGISSGRVTSSDTVDLYECRGGLSCFGVDWSSEANSAADDQWRRRRDCTTPVSHYYGSNSQLDLQWDDPESEAICRAWRSSGGRRIVSGGAAHVDVQSLSTHNTFTDTHLENTAVYSGSPNKKSRVEAAAAAGESKILFYTSHNNNNLSCFS